MDKVIVYVDDADHMHQQISAHQGATHWVVVACAPRMAHRMSKGEPLAREHWRTKWAGKLFEQVILALQARGDAFTPVLARGPLPELTRLLMAEHGTERVPTRAGARPRRPVGRLLAPAP